jgi:NADP-dependent 3-hydroxy acid dehydrogenase YdfG
MSTDGGPEVVVITGASAGVGRATVQAFAREGAHVGLLARGRDGLEGARREAEEAGGWRFRPTSPTRRPSRLRRREWSASSARSTCG